VQGLEFRVQGAGLSVQVSWCKDLGR
jgi:hypothetical protein